MVKKGNYQLVITDKCQMGEMYVSETQKGGGCEESKNH